MKVLGLLAALALGGVAFATNPSTVASAPEGPCCCGASCQCDPCNCSGDCGECEGGECPCDGCNG